MAEHNFRIHLAAALAGSGSSSRSPRRGGAGTQLAGPGSYTPRDSTRTTAPRATFAHAQRFLPSRIGNASLHHNTDLLCTASPGPKYNVTAATAATYPRSPALSWGDKAEVMAARERRATLVAVTDGTAGPAAYSPRYASLVPAAPRVSFPRSPRFAAPVLGSATSGAVTALSPNLHVCVPVSPRYSFAPPAHVSHGREGYAYKPRTSFMTHSIRGGLAKPATLECNIGPADYHPHERSGVGAAGLPPVRSPRAVGAASSSANKGASGFGSSPRFLRPGLQYLSAEHARAHVGAVGPGSSFPSTHLLAASRTSLRVID